MLDIPITYEDNSAIESPVSTVAACTQRDARRPITGARTNRSEKHPIDLDGTMRKENTLSERTTLPQEGAISDTQKDLNDICAKGATKDLAPERVPRPGRTKTSTNTTRRAQRCERLVGSAANSSQSDVTSAKEYYFPANTSQAGQN